MQDERVRELIEAADVFKRVLEINHPWNHEMYDEQYLSRYIPGVWPRWGEFRRLLRAIAALSSPAEIRKGDDWKSLSVTAIAAENTSVAEYVGSLEARIAELEATLKSAQ